MNFADLTDAIQEPHNDGGGFSEKYINLRHKENWLSSDTEVRNLPDVPPLHPHYKEWQMRMQSCKRLIHYLLKKDSPNILEVGCGNGWLSYQLARIPYSKVTGIDINTTELVQAKRVFMYRSNLSFIWGDIRSGTLKNKRFDIVVLAAAIQYFADLQNTLNYILANLMAPGGEIHLLDSPIYHLRNLSAARSRSIAYYTNMGFPEMINYYYHHSLEDLRPFSYKILYNPLSLRYRIIKSRNPFYWIRIKNA